MEWAIRKNGIPEVLVKSVMSLYMGARTRVRLDSELSEEFEVNVGMHNESVLVAHCVQLWYVLSLNCVQ